ncbi:hypothetical protein BXE05_08540 [Salmonella enterica subsp. enterica]|nr:hypothetical protein [Salmonella enterica subsp. enterica serovar Newport]EBI2728940.1 hypothetical protein [Salmonella enterica]EBS6549766.1 hypothetical protein [Salmonella enterica subsp. enterica serovar Newport]EBW5249817.1 hypothetical protein [Salmonella enterica subsp. enterica serovar Newport]EBX3572967.1 hypothetical protein [Salmonella enterica subsp. enterica serovar Newport]
MKLIDLLVQELPKRGGWPVAVSPDFIQWCNKHNLQFEINHNNSFFRNESGETVTFIRYQCATTAVKHPVWNGEGLPPVGCEFEYGTHRTRAKCLGIGHHMIFASKGDPNDEEGDFEEFMISILDSEFRPISSESEKKREIGVTALALAMGDPPFIYGQRMNDGRLIAYGVYELYDKIAAGKVAGIRIE